MSFPLYLDENINALLADMLAQLGHDVVTTHGAGRRGAPDEDQVAFATANLRAIVTHDREDYRRIAADWANAGQVHYGIVFMRRDGAAQPRSWILELFDSYPNGIQDLYLVLPFRG